MGDVRVRVRGERGVRGEGMLSQVLEPLGGGGGMVTPERWQQPSASDIQASSSFSLSQSGRGGLGGAQGSNRGHILVATVGFSKGDDGKTHREP